MEILKEAGFNLHVCARILFFRVPKICGILELKNIFDFLKSVMYMQVTEHSIFKIKKLMIFDFKILG